VEWYLKNQDWVEGVITGGTGDEPSMAAANFGDLAGQKHAPELHRSGGAPFGRGSYHPLHRAGAGAERFGEEDLG